MINEYVEKDCGTYRLPNKELDLIISNGYTTEYGLLHGTNAEAGGFQMTDISITVSKNCKRTCVVGTITYEWNDIMDPNPIYFWDRFWGTCFKLLLFPEDYRLKISWTSTFANCKYKDGSEIKSGYPLK